MATSNPLTKQFLLAAKYQEIHALKQLQNSCASLTRLGDFVHQLQKERAMSNIFLASNRERFKTQLQQQIHISYDAQTAFYDSLKQTYINDNADTGHTRLFNLIAHSLQSLDALPLLRNQIAQQNISAVHATQSFTQLITNLLNIILEAADGASDPKVTRLLVAFFNFMQGKEYAGQERACGAQAFAASKFTIEQKQQLAHFVQEQNHSFDFFYEYADEHLLKCYATLTTHQVNNQVEQLRSLLQKLDDENAQPLSQLSEVWYEVTTTRIDIMHKIEQNIADNLIDTAAMQIACAQRNLNTNKKVLNTINEQQIAPIVGQLAIKQPDPEIQPNVAVDKLNSNKSMYDLIIDQSQHIKLINQALIDAKKVISEQKIIHQAKYLLIEQLKISEEQAHKQLQKQAMNTHKTLYSVAKEIVALND
ncbi:response regulator NasT [Pseudoalteromonas sp. BSi20652]|uniref:nitrate- and nitrite sensing domain-containing protein n=1 Tax=Pseudoalteromonas sp. BSi20652 TaxID=388384 RepID=UPI0002319BA4|nr:nitrate- and nitrite sensing domain-containing protein [Pseudoalteromonas sp. BSi20652]GAA59485.1 response regulator NasT [Pseudoalteromonas sp. BSi20652]